MSGGMGEWMRGSAREGQDEDRRELICDADVRKRRLLCVRLHGLNFRAPSFPSLVAQCLDGIETCRLPGRIDTKHDTNETTESKADECPVDGKYRRDGECQGG